MSYSIWLIVLVAVAVIFLKGFDRIAGRGPHQVKKGIRRSESSNQADNRRPCPHCAERILLEAVKCPFCKSEIKPQQPVG